MKTKTLTLIVAIATLFGWQAAAWSCSAYDVQVLSDRPLMFLPMVSPELGKERDVSKRRNSGTYYPLGSELATTGMPNGDLAVVFNGQDQYVEVADADALSVPTTGVLSLEAWIRPDTLQFSAQQGSGYVHWMGKGAPSQHEYAMRMYSYTNAETPPRPNRISGYAFNFSGGFGSGSYFQDVVAVGQWIHVTLVINTRATSSSYPTGYVKIFKNGALRDTTALNQYDTVPGNGTAPLRIGTRDLGSFFKGAIGKVAAYDYELPAGRIAAHYQTMCGSGC